MVTPLPVAPIVESLRFVHLYVRYRLVRLASVQAVRQSIGIPMLANGDIQTLEDAKRCMEFTGADGVMSADPLLAYPALFRSASLQSPYLHTSGPIPSYI